MKDDTRYYQFLQNEFRLVNFFNVKTGMSDTSSIDKPSDLYRLDFDTEADASITDKDKEIVLKPLDDFEKKMLGL